MLNQGEDSIGLEAKTLGAKTFLAFQVSITEVATSCSGPPLHWALGGILDWLYLAVATASC